MYDSLILCCTGNFPNSHQKSLMNAFLCIPIIVPRPFMKIIEEISPKANPFTTTQECFCFHLQRGNPCCVFVTEKHLSLAPSPDNSVLLPWPHWRHPNWLRFPQDRSESCHIWARWLFPCGFTFAGHLVNKQSFQVRNCLGEVFMYLPWKPPVSSSLSELFSSSLPPCFSGDSFHPCSGDNLLKVNAKCVMLPLSLKKSVLYKVVCCSVLKACPIPRKPWGSTYLQTSCLSAQDRVLTHSWMQYTTLKGGTQQTCKYRKYQHCFTVCICAPFPLLLLALQPVQLYLLKNMVKFLFCFISIFTFFFSVYMPEELFAISFKVVKFSGRSWLGNCHDSLTNLQL